MSRPRWPRAAPAGIPCQPGRAQPGVRRPGQADRGPDAAAGTRATGRGDRCPRHHRLACRQRPAGAALGRFRGLRPAAARALRPGRRSRTGTRRLGRGAAARPRSRRRVPAAPRPLPCRLPALTACAACCRWSCWPGTTREWLHRRRPRASPPRNWRCCSARPCSRRRTTSLGRRRLRSHRAEATTDAGGGTIASPSGTRLWAIVLLEELRQHGSRRSRRPGDDHPGDGRTDRHCKHSVP